MKKLSDVGNRWLTPGHWPGADSRGWSGLNGESESARMGHGRQHLADKLIATALTFDDVLIAPRYQHRGAF